MQLERTHAGFATTRWTLLARLHGADSAERAAAQDTIFRTYWPPVYASLRRMGKERDEASELTQSFFADVVLGRSLLESAEQTRGKLRSLILVALKRFTVDQHRRKGAGPQRSARPALDLDREEAILCARPDPDPDAAFDRRWALALFNQSLQRCETHFRHAGKARNWDAFSLRIIRPAMGNCPPVPLARVAEELGFATPADAAAAVQTVKKRVLAVLRDVVAETADDSADAEYQRVVELLL